MMSQYRHKRNVKLLWALVVAAIAYATAPLYLRVLARLGKWDGGVGVVLGLYICSQPAANLVDLIFYGRYAPRTSKRAEAVWVAMNVLVLLIGCVVMVIATTRFATHAG